MFILRHDLGLLDLLIDRTINNDTNMTTHWGSGLG